MDDTTARTLFQRWLDAPHSYHLTAFQVVSALRRLGYRIERRGMGLIRPWLLVRGGEVVAQEFYPLAERVSQLGVRVIEPAHVIDNGERLSGPLVFGERKDGAWRWYAAQERMRAVGEA